LTERVRDDWEWPNLPDCWSASDEEVRGIDEFRERFYGTSSSEPESDADNAAENPYQFDSPDSLGDAIEMKILARKRRRRIALESEATWNRGLATFVAQQDAWTGAAAVKKYGTKRPAKAAQPAEAALPTEAALPAEAVLPTEAALSAEGEDPINPASPETPTTPVTASSSVHETTTPSAPEASTITASGEPLIPVAPPLLPGNSIRKSISPKTYPDIYNKIVMSSRTPSVPINLADMTKALVQGWKENGEWPPKAAPLDPLAGRKRALASVKLDNGDHQFLSHHPHVKKGMESVKRIFHLNGNHESGAVGNNG
jgi:hypothetical protein